MATIARSARSVSAANRSIRLRGFSSSSRLFYPSTSSIHPDEVAHFTRLSSTWWDPHGELGLLHKMNKGRVQFLKEKMIEAENWEKSIQGDESFLKESDWIEGKKVLDVGCGGGLLSESLARLGASVMGIDATGTNISIAEHHSSQDPFLSSMNRLTYKHCAAEDLLTSHSEAFDVVASVEVLEHVSNPRDFLQSLNKLLKPGGHLLLSTISKTFLARLLTIEVAENILGLVSKGTHSYDKFIKSSHLKEFIRHDKGLNWKWPNAQVGKEDQSFGGMRPIPFEHLTLESRGILYNPFIADWTLLDRHSTLQKMGLGEECNYLIWARKPY
ncbi:unnamed protein product [Sympodiomycopsis kandeliae]